MINGSLHRIDGTFEQHVCSFYTYPYHHIYRKDDIWVLEIDKQSETEIFFCPFCGGRLPIPE